MTLVPPAMQLRGRGAAGPELAGPELVGPSGLPEPRLPLGPGASGVAGPALDPQGLEGQGPERQASTEGRDPLRHLRVVPKRGRRRPGRQLLIYSLVASAVVVAFGLVSLHVMIAEAQFRLDHLQQEAAAYQARYEKLQLQVALDEAPSRIAELAIENGLQQPASVTYLPAPAQQPGSGRRGEGDESGGHGATASVATGTSQGTVAPPAGTGDWPSLKPYLSATP